MKQKGFTLIELLVVIAIIGLLSSLAVVSLNSARSKAYDAQIKSDLSQIRTWATVTFENGVFTTFDTADVTPALTPPTCSGGTAYAFGATDDAWAAWAPLCADSANDFCTDSTGVAKVTTGHVAAGATACP